MLKNLFSATLVLAASEAERKKDLQQQRRVLKKQMTGSAAAGLALTLPAFMSKMGRPIMEDSYAKSGALTFASLGANLLSISKARNFLRTKLALRALNKNIEDENMGNQEIKNEISELEAQLAAAEEVKRSIEEKLASAKAEIVENSEDEEAEQDINAE